MGEFVDDLMQFFPDNIIRACQNAMRKTSIPGNVYFLGVDVDAGAAIVAFTVKVNMHLR
jgi:hypothetical protein